LRKALRDVEWANDTLSFIVRTLQGKIEVSLIKGRIQTALIMKKRLEERGFWWQARIAEAWIHRAQGGEFS
jgi:hypothetical protein